MEKKSKDQYVAEIKERMNWEQVEKEIESEKSETDGGMEGCSFLGTVFSVSPSGKYYTPFANSNVEEDEAEEDEKFYAALDEVAAEKGYYIRNGEGDPCDLFICKFFETEDEEVEG